VYVVTLPLSLTDVDASRWCVFCPLMSDDAENDDVDSPTKPGVPCECTTVSLASSPPKRVSKFGCFWNKKI